jgi:hypothetical protein
MDESVSFRPKPLYSLGSRMRYLLDRRLSGSQSPSESYEDQRNLSPAGIKTPAVQPVTRSCTDWAIPALTDGRSKLKELCMWSVLCRIVNTLKTHGVNYSFRIFHTKREWIVTNYLSSWCTAYLEILINEQKYNIVASCCTLHLTAISSPSYVQTIVSF